jgi:hypothetical protein
MIKKKVLLESRGILFFLDWFVLFWWLEFDGKRTCGKSPDGANAGSFRTGGLALSVGLQVYLFK